MGKPRHERGPTATVAPQARLSTYAADPKGDGYSHLPAAQRADGSIKHAHFPGSTGQLT
jgi:hypothetical protein